MCTNFSEYLNKENHPVILCYCCHGHTLIKIIYVLQRSYKLMKYSLETLGKFI